MFIHRFLNGEETGFIARTGISFSCIMMFLYLPVLMQIMSLIHQQIMLK